MEYQDKLNWIVEKAGECVVFDEYADAFVGYVKLSDGTCRAAYDKPKLIKIIEQSFDLNELEEDDDPTMMAYDHYYYNVVGLGLSNGTPVFLEGFYDDDYSDFELEEGDHLLMEALIEEGDWKVFECDAESFEFDYLLILNGDKMKTLNKGVEGFSSNFARLYRFNSEEKSSISA